MAAMLSLAFNPTEVKAATAKTEIVATTGSDAARADALLGRLHEIKKMDMSTLSPAEKKELRKEVRSIRDQLKDISGGVYISATALIIILILLIILT